METTQKTKNRIDQVTPNYTFLQTQKDSNSSDHRDACSSMFIAAPFTRAKSWDQPTCPSVEE